MLDCSKLESETERLECYDEVAGRVEKKLEEDTYSGTTEERVDARNESITEEVVGPVTHEQAPVVLKVEIKTAHRDRNRRVTYETVDGRYFRRNSSTGVTFKPGDVCKIEKGVMSAIFLVREDGKRNKVKELSVE